MPISENYDDGNVASQGFLKYRKTIFDDILKGIFEGILKTKIKIKFLLSGNKHQYCYFYVLFQSKKHTSIYKNL